MTEDEHEETIQVLLKYNDLDALRKKRQQVKEEATMLTEQVKERVAYLSAVDDAIALKQLRELL